jgi:hypothetical protein
MVSILRGGDVRRSIISFMECSNWNLVARSQTEALPNSGRGWGGMWVLIRRIRKLTDWCVCRYSSIARGTVLAPAEFRRIPFVGVIGLLPS